MGMHWKRGLAVVAVAALLGSACGDDDDDASPDDAGTEDNGETDDGAVVEITGVDYAFEGVPASVAAGTRLTFTNASEVEVHEIVVIGIQDGVELSVEELFELPEEEADEHLVPGPPVAVIVARPGDVGFAVPDFGDGTLTEPGRYALACFIPLGADPDEFFAAVEAAEDGPPDVEGGPPHITAGMFAELIVE